MGVGGGVQGVLNQLLSSYLCFPRAPLARKKKLLVVHFLVGWGKEDCGVWSKTLLEPWRSF